MWLSWKEQEEASRRATNIRYMMVSVWFNVHSAQDNRLHPAHLISRRRIVRATLRSHQGRFGHRNIIVSFPIRKKEGVGGIAELWHSRPREDGRPPWEALAICPHSVASLLWSRQHSPNPEPR